MNSVRDYTQTRINPLLEPKLETEPAFIPETVPAFSATEVFDNLRRKNLEYKNFLYREAALNPTNQRDKADAFETKILNQFRLNSSLKELSGYRNFDEGKVFYIARPLAVTEQSCLRCHSTPEQAPKSQLITYGTKNGFGWKLNEIVATQIIFVPSEDVFNYAFQDFVMVIALFVCTCVLMILLINFLLKKVVLKRIKKISFTAQAVSKGDMDANFDDNYSDEIGELAVALKRIKSSLQIAMNLISSQPNQTNSRK
jgi:HAMP domain-containing protein